MEKKETTTQRKRRLAKAREKRRLKMQQESPASRELRLAKSRKLRKANSEKLRNETSTSCPLRIAQQRQDACSIDFGSGTGFQQLDLNTTQDFKNYFYRKNLKNDHSDKSSLQFIKDEHYKCILCSCDVIIGNRWHCIDCPSTINVNFCNKCYTSDYKSSTHRSNHRLVSFDDDVT